MAFHLYRRRLIDGSDLLLQNSYAKKIRNLRAYNFKAEL